MVWHPAVLLGLVFSGQLAPLNHLGSLTDGLRSPARIAIAADGTVLVTDPYLYHIARFRPDGTLIGTWPVAECPVGVAVHPDGRYFVSYRDDARVGIYNAAFTRIGFLGEGVPAVAFVRPTDIDVAVDTGRIYVVDSGADRIYAFESGGGLATMFGERGDALAQFRYPSALGVDVANGRLIVADHDNFRVQIFTNAGIFLQRFGYRNKYTVDGQEGWMPRTQGVVVDAQGYIYVADALMGTVRIFSSSGVEIGKVVEYGSGVGNVRTPCDLALSPDGTRLYVVSTNTPSVEIYLTPNLTAVASASDGESKVSLNPPGTNDSVFDVSYRRGRPTGDGWLRNGKKVLRQPTRSISPVPGSDGIAAVTVAASPHDGPHVIDSAVVCGRCHGIVAQPGVHPGTLEGQTELCLSCHSSGGQAMHKPLSEHDIVAGSGPGRSHPWGVAAVNEAHGSTGPTPGGEMNRYLDGGVRIKCSTCHDQHTNSVAIPYLRRSNTDGAMCKECHTGRTDHTPSGAWQPDCNECHSPHDSANGNLSLVAASINNQTLGTNKPVVFTARSGPGSFDDGNPAVNDGVCQVCHTATSYHRQDGSGTSHNNGQNCIECHTHTNGFLPTGGDCISCHSVAQNNGDGIPAGGRRAVVGEFPVGDAHAHYGAQLSSAACTVCHDQGTHKDGYVDLVDPDGGGAFRFVRSSELTHDPDLSDFCVHCHDVDGASRLTSPFDPFGGGNVPPNVADRFRGSLQWDEKYGDFCFGTEGTLRPVNSHHDISDADQAFSGAKIECLNCHGAHSPSATRPLADPFVSTAPWTGDTNSFCMACHNGGTGPLDPAFPPDVFGPVIDPTDPRWASLGFNWNTVLGGACLTGNCSSLRGIDSCDYTPGPWYVDYSWTHSAHGPDSKRGWPGYSGAPGAVMDCVACHDPHGSYTPSNPVGNPYMIRDFVDGSTMVDDGTRPGGFNGPPWNTFGSARSVAVSVSGTTVDWGSTNGLCSACHASWLAAYDWHAYCNSCQTCHAHGMAWGEYDWVSPANDTPCPPPAPNSLDIGTTSGAVLRKGATDGSAPGFLLHQGKPDPLPTSRLSVDHSESLADSCTECHVGHRQTP